MIHAFPNVTESEPAEVCNINAPLNTSKLRADSLQLPDLTLRGTPYGMWMTIFLATLAASMSLVTIAGNLIVLLAFGLTRKLRVANNYFLVSLAVTDLLVGLICVPIYAQYVLRGIWVLGSWFCDIWLALDWTVCWSSRLTVLLITLDRFLSFKIPGKYRNWRSVGKVQVLIGIAWIVPALICFPAFIGWRYFVGDRSIREDTCDVQFFKDHVFVLILVSSSFWIVLFFMFVLYGAILKVAWNLSQRSDMRRMPAKIASEKFSGFYDDTTHEAEEVSVEEFNNSAMVSNICALKINSDSKVHKSHASGNSKLTYPSRLRTAINSICNIRKEEEEDKYNRNIRTCEFDSGEKCSSSMEVWKSPGGLSPGTGEYILGTETVETEGLVDSIQGDMFVGSQLQRRVSRISHSHPSSKLHETPSLLESAFKRSSSSDQSDLPVFSIYGRHKKQTTQLTPKDKSGCRFTENKSLKNTLDYEHAASESYRDTQARDDSSVPHLQTPPVCKPTLSCFSRTSCFVDLKVHNLPITTKPTVSSDLSLASHQRVVTGANEDLSQKMRIPCPKTRNQTTVPTATSINAGGDPNSFRLCLTEKLIKKTSSESVNSGPSDFNNSHADSSLNIDMPRRKISRSRSISKSIFGLGYEPDHRARKTLRSISFILGAYTLCWTPYHILLIVHILCAGCLSPHTYPITYWLGYLNSTLDPFCYAFANPHFRAAFLRILQLSWDRK